MLPTYQLFSNVDTRNNLKKLAKMIGKKENREAKV